TEAALDPGAVVSPMEESGDRGPVVEPPTLGILDDSPLRVDQPEVPSRQLEELAQHRVHVARIGVIPIHHNPPSMSTVSPVMYELASETMNEAKCATSSKQPIRPSAQCFR